MVMHELIHYNFNEHFFDKPKNLKLNMPNANSNFGMEKMPTLIKPNFQRRGSFVVGQKLRESKWFTHEETKVLCAVVETGFIVERKCAHSDVRLSGVAVWTPGFGKFWQILK